MQLGTYINMRSYIRMLHNTDKSQGPIPQVQITAEHSQVHYVDSTRFGASNLVRCAEAFNTQSYVANHTPLLSMLPTNQERARKVAQAGGRYAGSCVELSLSARLVRRAPNVKLNSWVLDM